MSETQCYLCGGPLVDGECPAYNWHDRVHRENRARLDRTITVKQITSLGELEDFLKS
jgi:hypothetical protein